MEKWLGLTLKQKPTTVTPGKIRDRPEKELEHKRKSDQTYNEHSIDISRAHELTASHKRETLAIEAASKPPMDSTAGKMLIALNKTLADKLVIKFKTVPALAKHDQPFTDYVWQCSLDQSKGLAIGTDYRSDKAAADFAHHIAEVEREAVVKEVNDARFASLIVDGATDSAIMEQDIIFLVKLSFSLQSRTCSVADRLQATISVLKLHTEQPGSKLQRVSGQNELCGVKLKENVRQERGYGWANGDVKSITPEWVMLKTLCYCRHGDNLHTVSWQTINRQFADLAGNMLALIDVVLCIPATSVEAEQGFSVMKRVKTDFRNRLKNPALQDLLRIILLSPPEAEFDPKKAIDHWYNTLDRRELGQWSTEVIDLEDDIDDYADLNDLLHSTAVM
ncbi:hypothetical protein LSH36_9g09065 [Paralvinella palmiformis]|uniref:HAT C-terminal dimerisation domain-containing protein n=1 Tax=Paralvinella palmiformis TaxID=53620 RepID=A0AAD9NGK4_9ANNE|nr:hypothetical protein LSH36_9g09065 [Paralvinella palmiformis]